MTDFLNSNDFQVVAENSKLATKKIWHKNTKLISLIMVILLFAFAVGASFLKNKKADAVDEATNQAKQVSVLTLDSARQNSNEINVSGVVKADSQVDVVALAGGTLRNVYFQTGDKVFVNQLLANIYDQSVLTSVNNSQTSYNNGKQNLESIKRITAESTKQAEISVKNAEINIQAAKDNYDNAKEIQATTKNDSFQNAIISYQSHINTIKSSLDQIDYIIGADDGEGSQLPSINETLAVKNSQTLIDARTTYLQAKNNFKNLEKKIVNIDNVVNSLGSLTEILSQTKNTLDKTIIVLDNTITNPGFSESSLIAQKNSMTTLRASVVNAQTAAQNTLQGLQNIDLLNKRELDSLQNAVTAANNQLLQAQTALQNSKASYDQQLLTAQSAIDGYLGQLNLVNTQLSDLSVKAPIAGTITKKYVELGTEVSPGQKIAEISQTDLVKIELELTSDDIYKISLGQQVYINDTLTGNIAHIDPSADSVTKKVKVEIGFNNDNKDLIAETFVDVKIPIDGRDSSDFIEGKFFIPLKAVAITQTEKYVFLVKDGKAIKTSVELGESEGDKIEVVNGLQDGDEIIIEGNRGLSGNEIVEVSVIK